MQMYSVPLSHSLPLYHMQTSSSLFTLYPIIFSLSLFLLHMCNQSISLPLSFSFFLSLHHTLHRIIYLPFSLSFSHTLLLCLIHDTDIFNVLSFSVATLFTNANSNRVQYLLSRLFRLTLISHFSRIYRTTMIPIRVSMQIKLVMRAAVIIKNLLASKIFLPSNM